jgi:hypothetical protein
MHALKESTPAHLSTVVVIRPASRLDWDCSTTHIQSHATQTSQNTYCITAESPKTFKHQATPVFHTFSADAHTPRHCTARPSSLRARLFTHAIVCRHGEKTYTVSTVLNARSPRHAPTVQWQRGKNHPARYQRGRAPDTHTHTHTHVHTHT